jgi:hypothetical protein
MPSLFRRTPRKDDSLPSESIATLIASLETNMDELRSAVSHREFREFIRDRDRSHEEAWVPIRTAALIEGRR